MESPEYKVIKSTTQYKDYCNLLEGLVMAKRKTRAQQDTIELLTLLIEKWDEAHNSFSKADPVELLAYLMKENKLRATALAAELEFSKSLLSDILHYRRGFSREIIRKLSARFKVSQELFNRPYKLTLQGNGRLEKRRVKKPEKKRAAC
jgi:HTH-type transcriptional regulator/antitoxin HigA